MDRGFLRISKEGRRERERERSNFFFWWSYFPMPKKKNNLIEANTKEFNSISIVIAEAEAEPPIHTDIQVTTNDCTELMMDDSHPYWYIIMNGIHFLPSNPIPYCLPSFLLIFDSIASEQAWKVTNMQCILVAAHVILLA